MSSIKLFGSHNPVFFFKVSVNQILKNKKKD